MPTFGSYSCPSLERDFSYIESLIIPDEDKLVQGWLFEDPPAPSLPKQWALRFGINPCSEVTLKG